MPAYDIDLTLDSLKIPNINGTFPFGTKITPTDLNKGGLSTAEVNSNIMMPFMQMRPKVCTADSTTSQVEYDAKIVFNAPQGVTPSAGYTLTMGDGTYIGCTVTYTNLMEYACTVKQSDGTTTLFEVPAGKTLSAMWTGTAWRWTTTGSVTANDPTPVSSAAVHAAIGGIKLRSTGTMVVASDVGSLVSPKQYTISKSGLVIVHGRKGGAGGTVFLVINNTNVDYMPFFGTYGDHYVGFTLQGYALANSSIKLWCDTSGEYFYITNIEVQSIAIN